jgi:membrane-associated phospholipid phosphatase
MTRCPWRYKLPLLGIFILAFGVFYLYPNAFPLFEPRYLPLLRIDRMTPFLPWTFLIYVSDYLLIFLPFLLIKEKEPFNAYVRMVFGAVVGCGLFFLFWPTAYPRPPYPKVDNLLIAGAMNFIAAADNSTNCFPSMHVALTGVSAWAMRIFGKKIHLVFWLWTLAIFVSTMTTKQHYFLDIVGGVVVMVLVAATEWSLFGKAKYNKDVIVRKGLESSSYEESL